MSHESIYTPQQVIRAWSRIDTLFESFSDYYKKRDYVFFCLQVRCNFKTTRLAELFMCDSTTISKAITKTRRTIREMLSIDPAKLIRSTAKLIPDMKAECLKNWYEDNPLPVDHFQAAELGTGRPVQPPAPPTAVY